jgi:hypothetical protein
MSKNQKAAPLRSLTMGVETISESYERILLYIKVCVGGDQKIFRRGI